MPVLQPKTEEQKEGIKKRLIKREDNKRNKLKDLGIEYDFDGYSKKAAALPSAQEKKAITDAKKLESQVKKDAPSPAAVATKTKASAAKASAKPNKKARKVSIRSLHIHMSTLSDIRLFPCSPPKVLLLSIRGRYCFRRLIFVELVTLQCVVHL